MDGLDNPVPTLSSFPTLGGNIPGLTVALDDDRCADDSVVPTRRGLRQNRSSRRHLARSRHVQNMFQALAHTDSTVRKAAQRILEASDENGDVDTTETKEDILGDAEEQTDAQFVADALGLEDNPEDELGADSEALSDVEFLNQIFGGQFDTPFFYAEDVNRVPVFVGGNFYIDFVPEEEGFDLPAFDPNAEPDEQDGSGENTSF